MPERFTAISRTRYTKKPSSKAPKTAFIAILILVSVFGFYKIFIDKKESDVEENTSEEELEEVTSIATTSIIETGEEEDAEVVLGEETTVDANFTSSEQSIGDETVQDVKLLSVEPKSFDVYLRVTFKIESSGALPNVNVKLTSNNALQVTLDGITEDKSSIKPDNSLKVENSVVSTIYRQVTSMEKRSIYQIGLKSSTKFYLHSNENSTEIYVDVLEQEVANGADGQEFTFSQVAQSFEGNSSGNVITMSGISHSEQASENVFRVTFRIASINSGKGTIPKLSAEITDYEGKKAIKVTLSNMYSDVFGKDNFSQEFASNKAATGIRGSFSGNASTYYILLSSLRDYKLYYQEAPALVIVDIKR